MTLKGRLLLICAALILLILVVIVPLLPLLITRRWDWWEAWAYAAVSILAVVASRVLVARAAPDLIEERSHFMQQEDTQPWDRTLAPLAGLAGSLIPLVAGVDALFGHFPVFSPAAKIAALIAMVGGAEEGADHIPLDENAKALNPLIDINRVIRVAIEGLKVLPEQDCAAGRWRRKRPRETKGAFLLPRGVEKCSLNHTIINAPYNRMKKAFITSADHGKTR